MAPLFAIVVDTFFANFFRGTRWLKLYPLCMLYVGIHWILTPSARSLAPLFISDIYLIMWIPSHLMPLPSSWTHILWPKITSLRCSTVPQAKEISLNFFLLTKIDGCHSNRDRMQPSILKQRSADEAQDAVVCRSGGLDCL